MSRSSQRSAASVIESVGWPLLGLVVAGQLGTFRRPRLLELFDIWKLYILAPWPLLALLAAWARSPSLGMLAGIGTALALAAGRAARGCGRRSRPTGAPFLRVLTANVLGGNPSAAGLVDLVDRTRPDVLAIQELRPRFCVQLVEQLAPLLPYFNVQPHEQFAGAGLFSHWPLEDLENFQLAGRGHLCQRARLHVDGCSVQVWNVHLDTPFDLYRRPGRLLGLGIRRRPNGARDDQIDRLLEALADVDEPVVVAGDFNVGAGTRPHRALLQHLRDAFLEVGHGFGHTYPQANPSYRLPLPGPVLRIDYVMFKGTLEPLAAGAVQLVGSDHRAVLAELELGKHTPARWAPLEASTDDVALDGHDADSAGPATVVGELAAER